jgi:hypothetical protein
MPRKPVTFLNTEYKTQGEFENYVKKLYIRILEFVMILRIHIKRNIIY